GVGPIDDDDRVRAAELVVDVGVSVPVVLPPAATEVVAEAVAPAGREDDATHEVTGPVSLQRVRRRRPVVELTRDPCLVGVGLGGEAKGHGDTIASRLTLDHGPFLCPTA